jgi:hypothetical protein
MFGGDSEAGLALGAFDDTAGQITLDIERMTAHVTGESNSHNRLDVRSKRRRRVQTGGALRRSGFASVT